MKVEFYKHNIGEEEKKKVLECLDGIFLTTGSYVAEFEAKFAHYLNLKHAVGLNSCTGALHLSLLAVGICPGDEVITTPMTFVATANSVIQTGAKTVFVDIEEDTANINANLIERAITLKTKAIIPVHLYGQMCDMKKIREIADRHNLVVIEDAAHAIEAKRDDVRPGRLGDTACFSFYATKNITCGEGGAIVTNNDEIACKLGIMKQHGITKGVFERHVGKYQHWDMEIFGWKYNMDNIRAALLINQLKKIEKYWQRREEICKMYEEAFKNIEEIKLLRVVPSSKNARHLFTILVPPKRRNEILWKLQGKGIGVAVNYRAVHLLKYYREIYGYKRGMFPIAENIGDSTITLPLYPKLSNAEVEYVVQTIKEVVEG